MKLTRAFLTCVALNIFVGCGQPQRETSRLDTVAIPQSPVENQGKIGLCWAYASVGLVESVHKSKTGFNVNLSEEAIGFYRIAHEIHEILQTNDYIGIIQAFMRPGMITEGWYPRLPSGVSDKPSAGDNMDALDLIKTYGVVPESAWNVKLVTPEERDALFMRIDHHGMKFFNTSMDPKKITVQDVINNIVAPAFGGQPPTEFNYAGKHYTAQEFLKHLSFNPDDYSAVAARSEAEYDKVIAATKRTLARGISVPLTYPINIRRLHGDMFSGDNLPADTLSQSAEFAANGGHVVLVTDFVNHGGAQGAVSSTSLKYELQRSPADLDYLVFKNSWGLGALTNEAGLSLGRGSDTGYYRMDQSYLRNAAKVGAFQGWTVLGVVVPNDIALDPFGIDPEFRESPVR